MSQIYELAEVTKQNGEDGKPVWIVIKGSVYDVTKFLDQHPGGAELIMEYAGRDATKAFNSAGHSSDALKDLKLYKIGEVAITSAKLAENVTPAPTIRTGAANEQQKSGGIFCCC